MGTGGSISIWLAGRRAISILFVQETCYVPYCILIAARSVDNDRDRECRRISKWSANKKPITLG